MTLISRQPGTVECVGSWRDVDQPTARKAECVGSWRDVDQPTARDSGLCGVMA